MPVRKKTQPSERELDVLKVLWRIGEAKVRDIHEEMCPKDECAFTTIQTLLRIMCNKGLVKKRSEKRTDFYSPVYSLENATQRFVDKVFDGALGNFVLSMVSEKSVSIEEMKKIEKMIAKARKAKQKDLED